MSFSAYGTGKLLTFGGAGSVSASLYETNGTLLSGPLTNNVSELPTNSGQYIATFSNVTGNPRPCWMQFTVGGEYSVPFLCGAPPSQLEVATSSALNTISNTVAAHTTFDTRLLSTDAKTRIDKSGAGIGYVSVAANSNSTTLLAGTPRSPELPWTTDQFAGRVVIFGANTTTASLRCQAAVISNNNTSAITLESGLQGTPVLGDEFTII